MLENQLQKSFCDPRLVLEKHNEHIHKGKGQEKPYKKGKKPGLILRLLKDTYHLSLCSPNSLLLGVLNSFLRCVRPFCHCCCPPFSAGHAALLFICLPGAFFTFVSQIRRLHCWCPPFSAGHAALLFICLPCDFFTFVSQVRCLHCWCPPFSAGRAAFLFICLPGDVLFLSLISVLMCLHCCLPLSAGHAAFLFVCLPCDFLTFLLTGCC